MEDFEFYWEAVSRVMNVLEIAVEGYFFCRFLRPFLTGRRVAEWTGFAYFAMMFFLWLVPWEIRHADLCGTAAAFLAMYLLDRRNLAQKIFLSVTGSLLFWIGYGFALIPWNACFAFVLMAEYMQKHQGLQFSCYVAAEVLHGILQVILLHFMVKLVHGMYVRKNEDVTFKELGLLLLPLCSVLVGRFILSFAVKVYLEDTGQYIWNVHAEYEWLKIVYQIVSFSAVLLTVIVYQRIWEANRREKEDAVLAQQEERMLVHIREVERLYGDLRGLRHDMNNHVVVLENLFLNREEEELKRYFKKLKEEFLLAGCGTYGCGEESGNPVTDIILAERRRQAQVAGVAFESRFHYPQDEILDAFDVSVILNNALANALTAAQTCIVPYVKVSSWRRRKVFMVEVENSFSGTLLFDGEGGLPKSTKRDGGQHGFGLANIQRMARKYCGDMDLVQEGECVRLSVMMMLGAAEGKRLAGQDF